MIVTTPCDGCITFHTDAAIKAGATKEEIVEALGVAIDLNAGAALVFSARVCMPTPIGLKHAIAARLGGRRSYGGWMKRVYKELRRVAGT